MTRLVRPSFQRGLDCGRDARFTTYPYASFGGEDKQFLEVGDLTGTWKWGLLTAKLAYGTGTKGTG